jgi:hypothetical protein
MHISLNLAQRRYERCANVSVRHAQPLPRSKRTTEIHNIAMRTYAHLSASSLLYSLNYPMSRTLGNRHLRCSVSIGIIKPMNASRRDLNNHSQASWEGNNVERRVEHTQPHVPKMRKCSRVSRCAFMGRGARHR